MTITFQNKNNVIVFSPEKVISDARNNQQIFVAPCVWWLASILGLEQGLVNDIGNVQSRVEVTATSEENPDQPEEVPEDSGEDRMNKVLAQCKDFLSTSRQLRRMASLKSKGKTGLRRINPTPISKMAHSRKIKKHIKEYPSINGIDEIEIHRRKEEGECRHCTWPSNRK
jgi:hypothetical protein